MMRRTEFFISETKKNIRDRWDRNDPEQKVAGAALFGAKESQRPEEVWIVTRGGRKVNGGNSTSSSNKVMP